MMIETGLCPSFKSRSFGRILVIICSNQQYRSEDAIGEVLYRDEGDWDKELLVSLVKQAGNI